MQKARLDFLRAAFTVAALILLIISLVFTSAKAEHHCNGEECPVCCVINVVKSTLKLLVLAGLASKVLKSICCWEKSLSSCAKNIRFSINTLIIQKTRLND